MKDNLMVRLMTGLILVGIVLAHFAGQTDLFSANWLWLAILPAFMGFQATFTGFCPAALVGKLSKTGECCPSGSCASTKTVAAESAATATKAASCCEKTSCCGSETPEKSTGCCGSEEKPQSKGCCGASEALSIKVLGTGCANCNNTVKLIQTTADEMGVKVDVIKVEDIAEIAGYGVMSTPGVVINDQVVHTGGVPSKAAISEWLKSE